MKSFKDLIGTISALALLLGIFAVGIGWQVGLGWVIDRGGGPMLAPLIAFVALGFIWDRQPGYRICLTTIAVALLIMVNDRGFYWEIFERYSGLNGEGFFTSNRVSAHAAFALAFAAPALWRMAVTRRSPRA